MYGLEFGQSSIGACDPPKTLPGSTGRMMGYLGSLSHLQLGVAAVSPSGSCSGKAGTGRRKGAMLSLLVVLVQRWPGVLRAQRNLGLA